MKPVIVTEHFSVADLIDGLKDVEAAIEQIEDCLDDVLDCTDGDVELSDDACDEISAAAERGRRLSRQLLESIRRTVTRLQLSSTGGTEHGR